jgi:ABC-type branched-subunit amino acid transport system permease subunit/ABC-type branched-subunit amino acid transport system ATPase component
LMVFLESFIDWRLGENFHIIKGFLPSSPLKLADGITVGTDRVIILGFSIVFTVVLTVVYSRTRFGLVTSAVAANEQASASLGHSPNLIANINWAIGGGIGALTGVLLAPIIGIAPNSMTLLIVPALAAALLGGFSSFTYVLVAAFAIGIAQSELAYYEPSVLGLSYALPFAFIVLIPFFRGQAIPGRGVTTISLPSVGAGGFRWKWAIPVTVIAALVSLTFTAKWQTAFSISCVGMILALSVVVITGYAGQLSLCQFTLAGFAAWVTGQASIDIGLPFTAALIIGPLAVMPVGLLVAIPALRTRGISLAVATLGFAVVAENMIFANGSLTGGFAGTDVGKISFFGWSVYPVSHPWRYAMITLAGALLCGFLVSTVRNSPTGRRLLAVRSNERAAASLGIGVTSTKLYAFVLSSAIAGLGGVLFAYSNPNINYPTFSSLNSITLVLFVVLAGIGYASGGILAGVIFTGGIIGEVAIVLFHSSEVYQAIAAFFLVINLVLNPDGLIKIQIIQINWVRKHWPQALRFGARGVSDVVDETLAGEPVQPIAVADARLADGLTAVTAALGEVVLEVSDLTVRFGGVTALEDLSFSVRRGEVVGLIGANGAGKSTLIDAVSGFVPRYAGQIRLAGADMKPLNAAQRARLGIRRTFQSLELFEDMTVFENIVTSCEPAPLNGYLKDLVAPPTAVLTDEAQLVSAQFGLGTDIHKRPPELSYGARRIAAIARAVAAPSRLLLLDEPTAGLEAEE